MNAPSALKDEEKTKVGHNLGTELVPICLDVKIQGRHVHEAFCIEPSADQYIANMAKQLCSEWQLNRNYEQILFSLIKEHIDKFKDSMTQLQQNGEGEALETIRLNFHLGQIHVKDQFLWDLADPEANPEVFAEVMCEDLKLPRQFVPEIACRIREQIIELKKNGPTGQAHSRSEHRTKPWIPGQTAQDLLIDTPQHDDDVTRKEEPQPKSIYSLPFVRKRTEWEDWGPHVKKLSDLEFKQMELRNKKARLQFGHSMKPNGSLSQSSRPPPSMLRTSSGGSSLPPNSKRQQQPQRIKIPQGKQKDSAMHMHPELSSPSCIPSPGTMVPMVPFSAQQQRTPGNPASIVRASPHHPLYNGGMQNPIGNQWTTPTSMNRIPMGAPGGPSHEYVDYMHLHAMQGLHEGRQDLVMSNGVGQQHNDRMQGTLGNLVGGPYQNGGMMQHLQNGHTVMQSPPNTLSWVMNSPYNHMYR